MASKDGKAIYYNYIIKEKRNIYDVLFDFNTVKIPFEYIIQFIKP